MAARDTTASMLGSAMFELSRHPDVLSELREEIDSIVGPDGAPTYDDIKHFKLLRAVFDESLRYAHAPSQSLFLMEQRASSKIAQRLRLHLCRAPVCILLFQPTAESQLQTT